VEEIGLGATSIIAALLHETVKDKITVLNEIDKYFWQPVSNIVEGTDENIRYLCNEHIPAG
jgi:GTP diphosphokinase / guanosine-3',5'-bis(diphosphate) 3'-diphosphatase